MALLISHILINALTYDSIFNHTFNVAFVNVISSVIISKVLISIVVVLSGAYPLDKRQICRAPFQVVTTRPKPLAID
jgi:hypothetical protein